MTFQVFHDLCRKICITKIFTLKKTIRDSHWKKIAWFYCVLWQIYNNLYYHTLNKWQMASSFHRFAWLWNWNTFINLSCNINHIDIDWDYCWWTTEFMHPKQPVWKCKIAFSDPARVLQKPKGTFDTSNCIMPQNTANQKTGKLLNTWWFYIRPIVHCICCVDHCIYYDMI